MYIEQLKPSNKFKFMPKQTVRTTTWKGGGEKMETNVFGSSVKGEVLRVNNRSVRVKLSFRDKDKEDQKVSLSFYDNEGVGVELI